VLCIFTFPLVYSHLCLSLNSFPLYSFVYLFLFNVPVCSSIIHSSSYHPLYQLGTILPLLSGSLNKYNYKTTVGINPNDSVSESDWIPLLYTTEKHHDGIVNLLLGRQDVNPDSLNGFGRALLSLAAEKGYDGRVKLLLGWKDVSCYNPLLSGWYLQQVTDSLLTITSLGLIAVAIAKSVDSYLATSIARLL